MSTLGRLDSVTMDLHGLGIDPQAIWAHTYADGTTQIGIKLRTVTDWQTCTRHWQARGDNRLVNGHRTWESHTRDKTMTITHICAPSHDCWGAA